MEEIRNELRPKSFRISDETAEKFKEISAQIGGNQQETLAKLIEAYEFQAGKAVLTDKKACIEDFEKYVTCITRMYMGSLEDNQNITKTVKAEFKALLESKDMTIQDLQSRCERAELAEQTAKETEERAEEDLKQSADEVARLKKELEKQQKDYELRLATLEEAKNSLSELCASLNKQLSEVEPIKAQLKELNALKAELSDFKAQAKESEFAHKQSLFDLKEQLQHEKMQHLAEIEEYQKRYKALLEKQETKSSSGRKKTSSKTDKAE